MSRQSDVARIARVGNVRTEASEERKKKRKKKRKKESERAYIAARKRYDTRGRSLRSRGSGEEKDRVRSRLQLKDSSEETARPGVSIISACPLNTAQISDVRSGLSAIQYGVHAWD